MIKKFTFKDFKSFEYAEFYLEDFTTLIGTNASGKSNAIEGIRILSDLANGLELSVVLDGNRNETVSGIRGGSKGCCRFNSDSFSLGCTVIFDDEYDLDYSIRIEVAKGLNILKESLYMISKTDESKKECIFDEPIRVPIILGGFTSYENMLAFQQNKRVQNIALLPRMQSTSILGEATEKDKKYADCTDAVVNNLKNILFLDPVPSLMRDYIRITDTELKPTAGNISSVLKKLCEDKDEQKKNTFLKIIKSLPENEITGISFIETPLGDVIFALQETYDKASGKKEKVDAKRLSDGTLRCVAIVAALLTEPENSMIIIEEIDNGIHPGRAKGLIESISAIGKERKIDLILTTHSATLLNSLSKENLSGVTVAYRDEKNGSSKFQALLDNPDYARHILKGLGDSVIDDSLINSIKHPAEKEYNSPDGRNPSEC